jgi:hypothetical protein
MAVKLSALRAGHALTPRTLVSGNLRAIVRLEMRSIEGNPNDAYEEWFD